MGSFPNGLTDEALIATILREALKGIEYLHSTGRLHRDVKPGNLLVHEDGSIKVGDFGVSAWLVEAGMKREGRQTFVGTPCWMAPEVMEQVCGYDYKADIWSLGITALELAKGQAPLAQYPPMKVLLLTLQNPPPTLEGGFSKSFQNFVESCLQKDPAKRSTASKLLEHRFFKQAKQPEYVQQVLLKNIPPLWERGGKFDTSVPDLDSKTPREPGSSWNFSEEELLEVRDNSRVPNSTPSQTTATNPAPVLQNTTSTAEQTTQPPAESNPEHIVVHKGRFTKTVISKPPPTAENDDGKTKANIASVFQIMGELQKQLQAMSTEIDALRQDNAQLKKELQQHTKN